MNGGLKTEGYENFFGGLTRATMRAFGAPRRITEVTERVLDRRRQIEDLYHRAMKRDAGQRSAFLRDECAGDEELRQEVESLLKYESGAEQLMEVSAMQMAARSLAQENLRLLEGRQISSYKILSLIGRGGMGEVYRAHDTKLSRDVAVKVLPRAFTNDPDRLARFEREARVLASLNHPNVGAIYGFEEVADRSGVQLRALILEFVDGDTLADRIARGPLSLSAAVAIARQVAEALDAAHEKGIVHRDLKPANIKITPDGTAKVLDFGLAAASRQVAGSELPESPMETVERTLPGVILGTVPYMSPEQARGQEVDKRTDVWAFGCVLFEMLTGRSPFAASTTSDTISSILERDPDWSLLPSAIPAGVRHVLRWTLEKDPKRRLRDIADARAQLEGAPASNDVESPPASATFRSRAKAGWAVLLVLAIALGAVFERYFRSAPETQRPTARFALPVAEESPRQVALSPDGRYIAYVAGTLGIHKIYLRDVSQRESRVISELPSTGNIFFSPDSKWCAFFETDKLKKVSVYGGSPITLADAAAPRGGTWGVDGSIVFSPVSRGGLLWLPPAGGSPQVLTTPDATRGETSHRWPYFLPGAHTVVFTAEGARGDRALVAVALDTKRTRVLLKTNALSPQFIPTGHLTYLDGARLVAVPFDLKTVEVTGPPVSLLDEVGSFGFSSDGMMVYSGAENNRNNKDVLVWTGRDGRVDPLPLPPAVYAHPRISPDGASIVLYSNQSLNQSLWLYHVARDTMVRFTFGYENWPVWTPDGKKIIYGSNRTGTQWDLFSKGVDGTSAEQTLFSRQLSQEPRAVSPNGDILVFEQTDPDAGSTLWQIPLRENAEARPLFEKGSGEMMPSFSPNGHWIAYVSPESGRNEVYVRSFTGPEGKWQISNGGGVEPIWSAAGNELFYRAGDKMLAVDVEQSPSFSFGKSHELFTGPYTFGTTAGQNYDVSRDGRRFLMVKRGIEGPRSPINIIVNWFSELRARVPVK